MQPDNDSGLPFLLAEDRRDVLGHAGKNTPPPVPIRPAVEVRDKAFRKAGSSFLAVRRLEDGIAAFAQVRASSSTRRVRAVAYVRNA